MTTPTPQTPLRIQRRRTKGWTMPPNTIYVGRPTRWGNPFTAEKIGRRKAIALYRLMMTNKLTEASTNRVLKSCGGRVLPESAIGIFQHQIVGALLRHDYLHELRGKNLACWCPLGQPCHADVLLELANK